jgi:hypothetical protein
MERTDPPKKSIRFDAGFLDASPGGCRLRRAIRNAKTPSMRRKGPVTTRRTYEDGPWFFSFRLGPAVAGCPAVRSALLPPVTTVAETVEVLRLSGPGQCPREPS